MKGNVNKYSRRICPLCLVEGLVILGSYSIVHQTFLCDLQVESCSAITTKETRVQFQPCSVCACMTFVKVWGTDNKYFHLTGHSHSMYNGQSGIPLYYGGSLKPCTNEWNKSIPIKYYWQIRQWAGRSPPAIVCPLCSMEWAFVTKSQ